MADGDWPWCRADFVRIALPDGPLSEENPIPIGDGWEVLTFSDINPNDSDKSFFVPVGYWWHILSVRVELAASAVVNDRQLAVQLIDNAGAARDEVVAGTTQAANESRVYEFAPSLADLTAFRDTDWLMTPIPPTWLLQPLHALRVYVRTGASIGDDMSVFYRIARKLITG